MSRLVRKLVVVLALGVALIPMSAFAASSSTTPLESIEHCVAPHMTQATSFRLTLAQAQQCAAGIAGASAVRASGGQDGYLVAIITTGPAAVASTTGPAAVASTSSSSHCYFRQVQLVSANILYLGQTMCYDYSWAWVSGGASQNCHSYTPAFWCNTTNYYYSPSQSTDYAEVNGNYYQTCAWFFSCFDRIWMDQWYDGSFHYGWWGV